MTAHRGQYLLYMSHRINVLRAYRELVNLIHRLAPDKVQPALQEARAAVQANKAEADPLRASDQLKDLYARISFLRMATPRMPRDRFFRGGAGSFVLRDGELVAGAARKESRCAASRKGTWCSHFKQKHKR